MGRDLARQLIDWKRNRGRIPARELWRKLLRGDLHKK